MNHVTNDYTISSRGGSRAAETSRSGKILERPLSERLIDQSITRAVHKEKHDAGDSARNRMDLFRSVFFRLWGPQKPHGFSSSTLSKVSQEILIYIMDYLHPESAVALSLACKHLLYSLGTRHFAKMCSSTHKLAVLELLAIDLQDQVACSACL